MIKKIFGCFYRSKNNALPQSWKIAQSGQDKDAPTKRKSNFDVITYSVQVGRASFSS